MELNDAVKRLSALAQESRLEVFRLLVKAGPHGKAAGAVARDVGIAANTLSAQLLVLSNAGLVKARRDGRSIIYAVNYETMSDLLVFLTEDCCGGRSEICAPLAAIASECCNPKKEGTMKRLHVHVAVDNLERSIGFYATLFAAEPSVRKADYAKWLLDDPNVNFAISARGRPGGVDHLGIQVQTDSELRELAGRLNSAGEATRDQEETTCCYAQSNKSWVSDPSGIRWETFFTFGEATSYGEEAPDLTLTQKQSSGGVVSGACRGTNKESR